MTRAEERGIWLRLGLLVLALVLLPTIAYFVLRRDPPPPSPDVSAESEEDPDTPAPLRSNDAVHDGRFLGGTVVDESGQSMSGVRVRLATHDASFVRQVRTDETGAFAVDEVPSVPVTVSAETKDYLRATLEETRPGDHEDLKIVLKKGDPIRGHVYDADGKPIAQASVVCKAGEGSGTTDEEGAFVFGTAEGCTAVARHQAFGVSDEVALTPGGKNELRLPSPAEIRGSVVDESGAVVAGGTVFVESFRPIDKDLDPLAGDSAPIDERGNFALASLVRGTYVLKAVVPDRPSAKSKPIEVSSGEAVRGVRIVLEKGVAVSGVVTGRGSRSALDGVRVVLDGEPGGPSTTTDDQGRFTLNNLPKGPLSLAFRHPEYRSRIVTLDLRSRSGDSLKIELNESSGGPGESELSGIGATLGNGRGGVIIAGVISGSPAESSGLLAGDLIVAIDGNEAAGFSMSDCINRIRGPEGTRVGLTVDRDGTRRDVTVTRALIQR